MQLQGNYYECEPKDRNAAESDRYPRNHVRFSPLLTLATRLNAWLSKLRLRPASFHEAMLDEFDRAAPLDDVLGTREEIAQTRNLVELAAKGFDANPFLSDEGRLLLQLFTMSVLQNRRRVLAHYHQNRKFIDAHPKLSAPLLITGLPRSGTTLLQRLLSEDPRTRSPHTFELESPLPPMGRGTDPAADPRIRTAGSAIGIVTRLAPGFVEKFSESHFWSATEMEESFIYMLMHHGVPMMNGPTAGQTYMNQFLTFEDKRTILRYERLFFTMLDAYRPATSHWTLKAPNYAPCFPLLFDEYPDVRVVVTHRNPLVTLPSGCRLLESWSIVFDRDGTFDKHRFGRITEQFVAQSMNVPFEYRKKNPEKESQIFDCMYSELFADPIGMVKRVYKKFDLEYTPEFERRMRVYLANNQQGKYGRHKYSLEEYGFTPEQCLEAYRDYMNHFGFTTPVAGQRPESLNAHAPLG